MERLVKMAAPPIVPNWMKKKYLLSRLNEIVSCRKALARGEWDTVARAGENLNGNAETFGFGSFSEIGGKLEESAENHVSLEAERILSQFEKVVAEELSKF